MGKYGNFRQHSTQNICFKYIFISVESSRLTSRILPRLHSLESKTCQNCLGRSWCPPQDCQGDDFTPMTSVQKHKPFGAIFFVKSSPTSEFFQTSASTTQSSLMMQAQGLLWQQLTQKNTYKRIFAQIRPSCSLTKQTTKILTSIPGEGEPPVIRNSSSFLDNALFGEEINF